MHINDVGQSTWEEIDRGAAGANYGWPASEGPDNGGPGVTAPLLSYWHGTPVPKGPGAAYALGSVPGAAVGMLVASDGALLVLTQSNVVRFTTP